MKIKRIRPRGLFQFFASNLQINDDRRIILDLKMFFVDFPIKQVSLESETEIWTYFRMFLVHFEA